MATVSGATDGPAATSIYSSRTTKGSVSQDPAALGKDDFMKLLMAQLQHQDPMKPMDDQAFIAQVAQFNSLDQLTTLNKTVEAMFNVQGLTEASAMIGKVVTGLDADGESVTARVTAAGLEDGKVTLHLGASRVRLDNVTAVAADEESLPVAEDEESVPAETPEA
jgi:flagellar basal-body rod modification protein FlgD